jgi:hypothetical protein
MMLVEGEESDILTDSHAVLATSAAVRRIFAALSRQFSCQLGI